MTWLSSYRLSTSSPFIDGSESLQRACPSHQTESHDFMTAIPVCSTLSHLFLAQSVQCTDEYVVTCQQPLTDTRKKFSCRYCLHFLCWIFISWSSTCLNGWRNMNAFYQRNLSANNITRGGRIKICEFHEGVSQLFPTPQLETSKKKKMTDDAPQSVRATLQQALNAMCLLRPNKKKSWWIELPAVLGTVGRRRLSASVCRLCLRRRTVPHRTMSLHVRRTTLYLAEHSENKATK